MGLARRTIAVDFDAQPRELGSDCLDVLFERVVFVRTLIPRRGFAVGSAEVLQRHGRLTLHGAELTGLPNPVDDAAESQLRSDQETNQHVAVVEVT